MPHNSPPLGQSALKGFPRPGCFLINNGREKDIFYLARKQAKSGREHSRPTPSSAFGLWTSQNGKGPFAVDF